jgi:hydroxymethylbilane synthase
MKFEIVVGTRKSELALRQAGWVVDRLRHAAPEYNYRIEGIRTHGDNILDVALSKIGDKGLFTKELEAALLGGTIDLAVHSMKDMPTGLPEGLVIGAICRREFPGDVLISREGKHLEALPRGAVIGTSSLRRRAQLLHYRSDFKITSLRGNIGTRLRKLAEENFDAVILAGVGLHRMGWEHRITQALPHSICLPAVGQGAIGVEVREGDTKVRRLVDKIDHHESRLAVTAERAFLKRLEGGCQVPIGAFCILYDGRLQLEGVVAGLDGQKLVRSSISGGTGEAAGMGIKLAENLLQTGAREILEKTRQEHGCDE